MILYLAILLVIVSYIWHYYENVRRYPKGPTPWPLIGNLLMYDWPHSHLQLSELSKIYGKVFTIWLPRPFVCVMDFDIMKDAFKNEDVVGRSMVFPDVAFMNVENGGVIWSQGESWKEQRRVSIQIMRDFGMGKNLMETQISDSMRGSLAYLETENLEQIDTRWAIQMFVSNVISNALFNIQYKLDDCDNLKRFSDTLIVYIEAVKASKLFFLSQTWPWLKTIPLYRYLAFKKVNDAVKPLKRMIRELTEDSIKDYDPTHEPECLAQAYFQKMQTNPALTHEQMINVCMDFFLGGMETSSTTLRWALLFLAKYPQVQTRMREEIAKEIGFDDLPQTKHRQNLPYCNAVIQEIQRCANIIPMNVIHRTVKDTVIGGQRIPEDTFVLGQISHVMSNSSRFADGGEFRPERFLLEDGITPNKESTEAVEHFVPFGIGRRQCAGEALARVELFIGLLSLVQHYQILPEPNKEIDVEPIYGMILLPKPQKFRLLPVKNNNNNV